MGQDFLNVFDGAGGKGSHRDRLIPPYTEVMEKMLLLLQGLVQPFQSLIDRDERRCENKKHDACRKDPIDNARGPDGIVGLAIMHHGPNKLLPEQQQPVVL